MIKLYYSCYRLILTMRPPIEICFYFFELYVRRPCVFKCSRKRFPPQGAGNITIFRQIDHTSGNKKTMLSNLTCKWRRGDAAQTSPPKKRKEQEKKRKKNKKRNKHKTKQNRKQQTTNEVKIEKNKDKWQKSVKLRHIIDITNNSCINIIHTRSIPLHNVAYLTIKLIVYRRL